MVQKAMTTPDISAEISRLDLAFQKLTGQKFARVSGVCNPHEAFWFRFIQAGFTVHDLEIVILWLKEQIRAEKRHPACITFRRLVQNLDTFEDELAYATAEKRNLPAPKTAREQELGCLRPEVDAPQRPQSTPLRVKRPRDTIPKLIAALREAVK